MNQRLIWNFEFSQKKPFTVSNEANERSNIKWEIRYFWKEAQVVTIHNIDKGLLDISNYKQKQKEDIYFLVPKYNYNIKLRRFEMIYKPILKQSNAAIAFGAKIHLEDVKNYPDNTPATAQHLQNILHEAQNSGIQVGVKKESFTYKFKTNPPTKLELAKLEVNNSIYFSACIEGKSCHLVELINAHLFHKETPSDYVTFLKSILKS